MAWLGKFDDFDQFDGSFGEDQQASCSFKKHKPSYSNRGQAGIQQQTSSVPAEEKRLRDVTCQTSNATLTGVIIAKEQPRSVFSKKNSGSERHLVSFTLRDSASHFVNVTCWGNIDFINDIANNFQVGHVVKLKNVQVQQKTANSNDDKFKPWTPVPFQVSVSESHGAVEAYTGWDAATFRNTLFIPTRPSNDYYTLEDINISGSTLDGEHINILAAVKKVGQIRYLTTKTGKETKKCDVVLFDDTCPSFPMDLWGVHADASLMWTPFETVLFVADIKTTFNNFKSCMVATPGSKTIFTTDPDTQEARCLRQFLRTQDKTTQDLDFEWKNNDPDPSSITEVFTVQQVKQKQQSMAVDKSSPTHYGVLQAMVTTFNIDANNPNTVRRLCGRCRKVVTSTSSFATCTNPECNSVYASSAPGMNMDVISEYNISVALSDHTGTVSFCHLQSSVAEAMIGCKPEAFLMMPESQLTLVKWQFLMEQCKVVFKLKAFRQGTEKLPSVQVLALERPVFTY